jgi:uncharacterized protein YecT (DUF1311 family)
MGHALMRAAIAGALTLLWVAPVLAQGGKPDARASAAIRSCIRSADTDAAKLDRCIGIVSEPCLTRDETRSTVDSVACIVREQKVWDDILNETFRRLRDKLDGAQRVKLRDMQRAWIASRDKTCAFYWDYFQGTMASPMSAACDNREIARRALFLLGFLNDAEGK